MIYFAVKIIKNLGYHLSQLIYLKFVTNIENSWQGVAYYFKKETMTDFGIILDGIFPMIYVEK